MRELFAITAGLFVAVGCASARAPSRTPPAATATPAPAATSPEENEELPPDLVFKAAVGTWDWWNGEETCREPHQLRFSPDRSEMILTFTGELAHGPEGNKVARYRILDQGSHLWPYPTPVVRAAMEGEDRRTDSGELFVWDLVMITPNRYHWHATHWEEGAVTKAIVRCHDGRPVEIPDRSATGE